MKRLLVTVLIVGGLLLVGCTGQNTALPETPDVGGVQAGTGEPPIDQTWISPGKVEVGNFYPGARAEWELQVHNGNSVPVTFAVTYRYPDNVGDGYVKPTLEVQDWVIIADTSPIVAPRSTKNILIALVMPKGAKSPGERWEFWVSVKDMSQTGIVRTELCSRCLVNMKGE